MPEIIIIAGPNGAGKTSFANEFLMTDEDLAFVNADEAARSLAQSGRTGRLDIAAGRLVLDVIDGFLAQNLEFVVETTLATSVYARRIPDWKKRGYWVSLNYLRLPSVETAIERVRRRVAAGGHSIPEPVIRRRFVRGLANLETLYKPIVDDWYVWDSLEGDFQLAEAWDD
jgi:predicted ABC-type ATPase